MAGKRGNNRQVARIDPERSLHRESTKDGRVENIQD